MKYGRSALIWPSSRQIWGRIGARSSGTGAAARLLLPRGALDRKERAEQRLLAVEVEPVGAGEALAELVAQLGPHRCRRALSQPLDRRCFGAGRGRLSCRLTCYPGQHLADQFLDQPV